MVKPVSPTEFLKKKTLSQQDIDNLVMEINRKLNMYSDDLGEFRAVNLPADVYKEQEKQAIMQAYTSTGEWVVTGKRDSSGEWLVFRPLIQTNRA